EVAVLLRKREFFVESAHFPEEARRERDIVRCKVRLIPLRRAKPVLNVLRDEFVRLRVRIARVPVDLAPADEAAWMGRESSIERAEPIRLGHAVMIGEGEPLTSGLARREIARGRRAAVWPPEEP